MISLYWMDHDDNYMISNRLHTIIDEYSLVYRMLGNGVSVVELQSGYRMVPPPLPKTVGRQQR